MANMTARSALRVVVVNYRLCDQIERQLSSGVFQTDDEIIVVDNASEPERIERLARRHGATPLLLPENRGFANAVNTAVRASVTRHPILLLNPDVHIDGAALSRLSAALISGKNAAPTGVAPVLVDSSGRIQVGSAGGPLTLGAVLTYFCFVSHLMPNRRGVFLTRRQLRHAASVDWLCMACLLLQSTSFDQFGEIPEDEIVYGEDLAWGVSATAAGAHFRLLHDVVVQHSQGAAGESALWVAAFERLLRRSLPKPQAIVAIGGFRVGLAMRRAVGRRVT